MNQWMEEFLANHGKFISAMLLFMAVVLGICCAALNLPGWCGALAGFSGMFGLISLMIQYSL